MPPVCTVGKTHRAVLCCCACELACAGCVVDTLLLLIHHEAGRVRRQGGLPPRQQFQIAHRGARWATLLQFTMLQHAADDDKVHGCVFDIDQSLAPTVSLKLVFDRVDKTSLLRYFSIPTHIDATIISAVTAFGLPACPQLPHGAGTINKTRSHGQTRPRTQEEQASVCEKPNTKHAPPAEKGICCKCCCISSPPHRHRARSMPGHASSWSSACRSSKQPWKTTSVSHGRKSLPAATTRYCCIGETNTTPLHNKPGSLL